MANQSYKRRSAPRRSPRRGWYGLIVAAAALLIVLLLMFALGRAVTGLFNRHADVPGDDPMFAPTPETVTRPPDLEDAPGVGRAQPEDPSQSWHYETLTPLTEDGIAAEG